MRIVLDTNILLVSISSKSKYRPILDAFLRKEYELCVTTDILLEYEEIISKHMGIEFAEYVLELIENAETFIGSPNTTNGNSSRAILMTINLLIARLLPMPNFSSAKTSISIF